MAEDGMLLNFAVNDNDFNLQPKFKGGSWKDRLVAKKVAHSHKHRTGVVQSSDSTLEPRRNIRPYQHNLHDEEFPNTRPVKRRRENESYNPSATESSARRPSQNAQNESKPRVSSKPREIVSSLFTYNPKPISAPESLEKQSDEVVTQPSNAPLIDGLDTFTSLGLSPTLAAHLLTKMELKAPTAIQKSSVLQLLQEDSDAFIQSETGSGKTLAYLLPLVQRLMSLSSPAHAGSESKSDDFAVHRNSGLFAIILAPTRELCKQIAVVLERLLGCANWIVAGTVIGGEKKKSEKARLRKGVNVLVATPGRLVDHLDNTKALDISNVRWLVLDEGDRLMDLGFEQEIQNIVHKLDEFQKRSSIPRLPERRTTILCSATMKMNVQRLGDISLKEAALIKSDPTEEEDGEDDKVSPNDTIFSAPAQLKQSYSVVASKLRFVTLTALLKRTFARKGSVMKAIVFLSCADSVDFHFEAFSRTAETEVNLALASPKIPLSSNSKDTLSSSIPTADALPIRPSPLLTSSTLPDEPSNNLTVYKLHGSLPQPIRTAIVRNFSSSSSPSLLLATDVASRGLDLPNLDFVIEYDPAFSSDDHLHRIGRTARLGRDGRAIIFLLPGPEEGYVDVLKSSYKNTSEGARTVNHTPADEILKKGFGPQSGVIATKADGENWDQKATDFQLDIERWVLSSPKNMEMARKAYQSHVRAYATHVAKERKWFDVKDLHLGHLAKAFGLRERPAGMGAGRSGKNRDGTKRRRDGVGVGAEKDGQVEVRKEVDDEAAKKMREKVRNRKKMMGAGADEFNIA